VPAAAHDYVTAMIDTFLITVVQRCARIRVRFKIFGIISLEIRTALPKEIIKYLLSLMERGLSPSGHSMVNALLFYINKLNIKKGFELKLPRPKLKRNSLQY
jgi:hypothetical protein